MFYPSREDFLRLSKEGNVIPVFREILSDLETPISAFMKIDKSEYSYLLESVEGGENVARYSFLGRDPSLVIESKGKVFTRKHRGEKPISYDTEDPLKDVKDIMGEFRYVRVKGLPRFCGGLVGYIGYDTVRFIEDIPDSNPEELNMPDMQLLLTDTMLIFDHVDHKIKVVSNALVKTDPGKAYDNACKKVDRIIADLQKDPAERSLPKAEGEGESADSNFSEDEFKGIVEKAKEYVRAGDVIQIVLSQRFQRRTTADPFTVYRALRSINPSPYMFYLKLEDFRMIGSSPEILVRCEDDIVEVRPIAGTRKRGSTDEEDREMQEELLADPKEKAEHIMLVDLGRNDIGRVCEYSSVRPMELMRIERYSHVMHIVSDVVGKLREDKDIFDLLRATFPAGTVTGAPKVRAMELIDELERVRRGVYAGCVGYFSFSQNLDMCITIRTIVMNGDRAYVQAGAGIVLDSDPRLEYKETINKAKAMMKAIDFAEKGLD